MGLKTKEVAQKLNVNSRTMLSWIKYLNIAISKNESGHYVYDEDDVQILMSVKKQLEEGKLLSEITCSQKKASKERKHMSTHFDDVMNRLNHLERQIQQKADEVVTVQLLNHRKELENLTKKIEKIETTLHSLKQQKYEENKKVEEKKKNIFRFFQVKETQL